MFGINGFQCNIVKREKISTTAASSSGPTSLRASGAIKGLPRHLSKKKDFLVVFSFEQNLMIVCNIDA
jgi:hypothetical protein